MMRLSLIIAMLLALISGCSKSNVVSPRQFTAEAAEVLRKTPGFKVEIVGDLQLKVTKADGSDAGTVFLSNAYDVYQQDTSVKDKTIQRFVTSWIESLAAENEPLEKTRFLPVLKDHGWLEETRNLKNGTNRFDVVYEDLNSELLVAYVQDSPNHVRFLTPSDLDKAKVDRKQLRTLACENLQRMLPELKYEGENRFYLITAGGDYEASLLLLDSVWKEKRLKMRGEVVVAVPARGFLLVGDSADPVRLAKMKELSDLAYKEGAYKLTPKLFIHRNNQWIEFTDALPK